MSVGIRHLINLTLETVLFFKAPTKTFLNLIKIGFIIIFTIELIIRLAVYVLLPPF